MNAPLAVSRIRFPVIAPGQLSFFEHWLPRIEPQRVERQPGSKLMRDLVRIIRRAASSGAPVPSNPILAIQANAARQSTARAVKALEAEGFFVIHVADRRRRITFPDGSTTGWGEFRPGHAPGPRRTSPPPKVRAANSPPLAPQVPAMPAVRVRPARECQYLDWPDDQPPPRDIDKHICGVEALRGKSWCQEHYLLVFVPSRRTALLGSTALTCSPAGGKEA